MKMRKKGVCNFIQLVLAVTFVIGAVTAFANTVNASEKVKPASTATVFNTEVIVRTIENFKNHADVAEFMDRAAANHISIVTVAAKQDEDDECLSGYVFYNSSIAPKASGYESFDALADVINEAHKRGIKVKAWIPQFHDKVAFDKKEAWQMKAWVNGKAVPYEGKEGKEYFVSPVNPEVQAYERSIIKEIVKNYNVDGVILDWIRFDSYNMDVSTYTRNAYASACGYDPVTTDFAADNAKRAQWQEWRTAKLAAYFSDVRKDIDAVKPGLQLGVYILPQEFEDVGQDAAKFANSIDFVSPMAYFDDWHKKQEWVSGNCIADTRKKVGVKKSVIPALDSDWTDGQYRHVYSDIRHKYPEINTLAFFVYGEWTGKFMKKIDYMRTNY